MVFCSKCGKEIPENAYFCPTCGLKTLKGVEANVSMPYGNMLSEMGKEMEKALGRAAEEMKKALNAAREGLDRGREDIRRATSGEPVVCPSCGEKSSVGDRFCRKCGGKL
jgi:predicted amidophosphoribosyltransferase